MTEERWELLTEDKQCRIGMDGGEQLVETQKKNKKKFSFRYHVVQYGLMSTTHLQKQWRAVTDNSIE